MDPANVILKSRLKPGRMLLVDTQEKSVIQDIQLKKQIAQSRPHGKWLKEQVITIILIIKNPYILNVNRLNH